MESGSSDLDLQKFKFSTDIFNLGIIACEVLTNCYPLTVTKIISFEPVQEFSNKLSINDEQTDPKNPGKSYKSSSFHGQK